MVFWVQTQKKNKQKNQKKSKRMKSKMERRRKKNRRRPRRKRETTEWMVKGPGGKSSLSPLQILYG